MQLSVIVPVYNAGVYLKPCLQSILDLPFEKEVIVVDDGSTDGEVDRLGALGSQLTVVRQTNQGVSVARNAGLEMARGEWIWFCDADDRVISGSSGCSLDGLEGNPLALLPFVWEENQKINRFEATDGEVPYNLWRCWFRREWIEHFHLRFAKGRKYGEDQEFILEYLLRTSCKTFALPAPVYYYTMRPTGSMCRSGQKWKKRWDVWCVLFKFACQAILTGQILNFWVIKQIKRLIKNLLVI